MIFFFGKRREVWPFIAYKDQIYDFSRVAEWESESKESVLARAEEEKKEPCVGDLGGRLLDILDMPCNDEDGRNAPGVKLWKTKRRLPFAMHAACFTD